MPFLHIANLDNKQFLIVLDEGLQTNDALILNHSVNILTILVPVYRSYKITPSAAILRSIVSCVLRHSKRDL